MRELHRLYWTQKNLMNDVRWRRSNRVSSLEAQKERKGPVEEVKSGSVRHGCSTVRCARLGLVPKPWVGILVGESWRSSDSNTSIPIRRRNRWGCRTLHLNCVPTIGGTSIFNFLQVSLSRIPPKMSQMPSKKHSGPCFDQCVVWCRACEGRLQCYRG